MSGYVYPILFLLALAFPLVFFPIVFIKKWKVGLGVFVGYLIVYLPFTLAGNYAVTNHGGRDWRDEWLPKHMKFEYRAPSGRAKSDLTILGALYWPCILLDNLIWHRGSGAELP